MNVGIVGIGNMGKNHLRICSEIEGLKVQAISDISIKTGKYYANKYNTLYNQYYEDLKYIDFVIIATPTTFHYEIAKHFIENNIHILIEKPVCATIEEVDNLISLAKEHNVKVMVGHVERFNPVIENLKRVIDNELGEVISFSFKRVGFYPQITDTGIILDLGIHDYDLCRYLFGDITSLYSTSECVHNKLHEDCSMSLVKTKNSHGLIENSWLTPYKLRQIQVVGENGVVNADLVNKKLQKINELSTIDYNIKNDEPLRLEILHFIDCIANNQKPLIGLDDGKIALDIAINVLESSVYNEIRTIKT